ncbi:MAG: cytochrome P450 [Acidimicrobiales bacterium]
MNLDQIMLQAVRYVGQRPRLSNAAFRFARANPFDPERHRWPYDYYDRVTAPGPVVYSRLTQEWTVSGYDEVTAVLRSPNVSTAVGIQRIMHVSPYSKLSPKAAANFATWMLFVDPPEHHRLRSSVSRAFSPRRIAGWEPLVASVTERLLAAMADDPAPDVIRDFAGPLPVDVIGEILGVPVELQPWLRTTSAEVAGLLDALYPFDPVSMNRRFDELDETFTDLVEQRRADPQDDLISALANDPDSELTTDDIVATIVLLMFAGHETTTGLIGNAICALAAHPDQRALLRSQPDLIGNAVEELARYDPPAQITVRRTTGPVEAGDTTIPGGANLSVLLGAANRDRRKWPDADRLRLDRPDPNPISFGSGLHYCLGAALARLETRIALPAFLDAFGDYTVDTTGATWKRSNMLRGPTSLIVRPGPA